METNPEALLGNLRDAKAKVEAAQDELAVTQRGRDAAVGIVHEEWGPKLDTVQKKLDAARLEVKNAQKAIDDATAPSKPAEVQEPETAPPPSETHHG